MSEQTLVLSLISHTNIGKTTLTRTLLRRDVGEVRDAPHVTDEAVRYTMWADGPRQLQIWDTPGFGNVNALLKRLQREHGALGKILNEVVDRLLNRALYSSLAAARNVRAEADVVLYLINAREEPEDAGYVAAELRLLDVLGKPVLMLINQVTPDGRGDSALADLERRWHACFADHPCLKGTLLLDAFTRSWHQELRLADLVRPLLPPAKQQVLDHLRGRFLLAQQHLFETCTAKAADTLLFALNQRVKRSEAGEEQVFGRLVGLLQERLDAYLDTLVAGHGIQAAGKAALAADIKQVTGLLNAPVSEARTGLLAGAVAGASSGLAADILSGGLTLGGGALLGFLGGYLGGFSTARLLNLLARGGSAAWKPEALLGLYKLLLSYYLLAALHGRGQGALRADRPAPFLMETVEAHWEDLAEAVSDLLEPPAAGREEAWRMSFQAVFGEAVLLILRRLFPHIDPGPMRGGADAAE